VFYRWFATAGDSPWSTRSNGALEEAPSESTGLCGEVTDITARYYLIEHEGKWVLAFRNFDVM
jgi:hypothetical protein